MLDDHGNKKEWGAGLEQTVESYFSQLFKTNDTEWNQVTSCISRRVSEAQNQVLISEVEEHEVKSALFSMHPEKTPGPDGMTPGFYKKCWHIVKTDVISTVRRFFSSGVLDDQLKGTNIALIPKKSNPLLMTDIRPISLCNVVYKIISKVMTNGLKSVIDSLISEMQSAFIPGRLITDNIMVTFEVMHYMKRKKKGRDCWMAL